MNRWEKAIAEIGDENLKKMLDDAIRLKKRYGFRYKMARLTGIPDGEEYGALGALMEVFELFAKRELGNRMKAHAAEKAKKEKGND